LAFSNREATQARRCCSCGQEVISGQFFSFSFLPFLFAAFPLMLFSMPWISFDLDGTLLDSPMGKTVFRRLREKLPASDVAAFRLEYRKRFTSSNPVTAFDWDDIHDQICDELGTPRLPRVLEVAAEAHWAESLLYPDTQRALEKLDARGWLLALGTNGFAKYQNFVLEQYGLVFGAALAPDTTGFVKPQAGFLDALKTLTDDENALDGLVHVGDLLSHDIACANNAGVLGAWVWRSMPAELQAVPIFERPYHPDFLIAIEREWVLELEQHGAFSSAEIVPKPDFIVADLLELVVALEIPEPARVEA
jgi:FMN phosphatase YigB (HAD superfamily)